MKPIHIKFNSPASHQKSFQEKNSFPSKKINRITVTEYLALQDLKTPKVYETRLGEEFGRHSIL